MVTLSTIITESWSDETWDFRIMERVHIMEVRKFTFDEFCTRWEPWFRRRYRRRRDIPGRIRIGLDRLARLRILRKTESGAYRPNAKVIQLLVVR